MINQIEFVS